MRAAPTAPPKPSPFPDADDAGAYNARMDDVQIRPARAEEAEMLSALCRRSKAHWGYDAAFLRLSANSLAVPRDLIARGCVLVAEDASGTAAGIASIDALERQGDYDLVHMFVEPGRIGSGVGRALFAAAAALARRAGAKRLVVLSDPHAADFYARMGARRVGEAPSDAVPGRTLPLLHYDLV